MPGRWLLPTVPASTAWEGRWPEPAQEGSLRTSAGKPTPGIPGLRGRNHHERDPNHPAGQRHRRSAAARGQRRPVHLDPAHRCHPQLLRQREGHIRRSQDRIHHRLRTEPAGRNVLASVTKGQPLVVTGRLNRSEWTGVYGTVRHSLTVNADAIGHDLTFGRAVFTRPLKASDIPDHDPVTGEVVARRVDDAAQPLTSDGADDEGLVAAG